MGSIQSDTSSLRAMRKNRLADIEFNFGTFSEWPEIEFLIWIFSMAQINNAAKAAGVAAEQDARWYIDRTFHNSKNYRVLHDVLLPDNRSDA